VDERDHHDVHGDAAPRRDRVFPDEFIFRSWTFDTPRNLAYISGDLPTIVVTS
jgi:hypothetical protein